MNRASLCLYNEIDPYAAQWLRNLIAAGHIAPGVVDERSICDLTPADVAGFTQVHFFAGIGGWSLAARLAGWPDTRELWTGSCPCQPFSVAGAGKAQADARHLWPEMFRLVSACRPDVVMGEQVAAAVGKSWLDGMLTDLESIDYIGRAAVIPACAVNAPHRRDRLWFVANKSDAGLERITGSGIQGRESGFAECGGSERTLADNASLCGQVDSDTRGCTSRSGAGEFAGLGSVGDSHAARSPLVPSECGDARPQQSSLERTSRWGAWDDAEFVAGADGKARRVKSGIRLLAYGVSGRVAILRSGSDQEHWYSRIGSLKGFGNAIVPQVAAEIIGAYLDCEPVSGSCT
jgi:DNA (cytosine-5)-methyltransferase 1